jgi:hypothetical protein
MKTINKIKLWCAVTFMGLATSAVAQNVQHDLPSENKLPTVLLPAGKIAVGANGGTSYVNILSNCDYTINPTTDGNNWFKVEKESSNLWKVKTDFWYKTEPKSGVFSITLPNGQVKDFVVEQKGNNSATLFTGDAKCTVKTATASSQNSTSEGIANTYDGKTSTYYHSKWSGGVTTFPVTLTYELLNAPHVDYLIYTPRVDGQENGNFGVVTVEYSTADAPNTFVTLVKDVDMGFSSSPFTVQMGKDGVDNVSKVKFTVKTGKNNYASCAEMEFFTASDNGSFTSLFTDELCAELKPGVTLEDINRTAHPFARQLASYLYSGEYETKYRVGEFEPYRSLASLQNELKTSSQYNRYENPTGIYFEKGVTQVLFVKGIQEGSSVNLIIKDFGGSGSQPETSYPLRNGVNIITPLNLGNGYVSYYHDDFAKLPNIQIHFALGKINGYFDAERGDTNEDWVKLLANAPSDIIDIRTKRIQVAYPKKRLLENCPKDGESLAQNLDNTIYREREIMGLSLYGREPKNRQFARVVWAGFMFADGIGAAANDDAISAWMKPSHMDFEFWGFAHELGHNNQITPGFKWPGLGETTNNIYSAWVQFKHGAGWYRLESEISGQDDYSGMKGGRFNCYLEQGVRMGKPWQQQLGPDYKSPTEKVSVAEVDEYGKSTGKTVSVTYGNYDHFVKLAPLWQLQLYCHQCGYAPNVYGKFIESVRKGDFSGMTSGQMQMNFMKQVCDSTGINFVPFFEKAGLCIPVKMYVSDYSNGWLIITEAMIKELKDHVAAKGYPLPGAEVNYINALNWEIYAEKKPLQGTLNSGCTLSGTKVTVQHSSWKNAVAFETYDENGQLLRISGHGLGGPENGDTYTRVLFPSGASYIMAVGYDGTRMKCFQK